ncbi:GntR family transcriptional regulator [Chitinophaga sp. SYP-B3965]|uniref:rhamnogalacturonan acetylesterase n=1 Tax=Chitinophaga sp. SYP-B3965 TaxID=2663120 RepID=UPI0012995DC9|nr:rhamnogalacturonan acetylesterase [Chitinophaga sp. SYP-B3965]MRG47543.1 GntR family transcriptional regulator [Chitinophaga sp. SYP-B3965]
MKITLLFLLLSVMPAKKQLTIWMIGDSTMSVKAPDKSPETGWGMALAGFFREDVRIENRAMNGRSTLSFINENRWQPIVDHLQKGDYVLIQFGHNDEKVDKNGVGVSLTAYKANLAKFITEARRRKAIPVLLTSIARRHFVNGVLQDTHKGYPDAMRALADSMQVPLIDLEKKSMQLLTALGDEGSVRLFLHVPPGHEHYPEGVKDNTHLSPEGANAIAKLAVEGMRAQIPGLTKYLR